MSMRRCKYFLCLLLLALSFTACKQYRISPDTSLTDSLNVVDTVVFRQLHHYARNYNFRASTDTLTLTSQLPEEKVSGLQVDSFEVERDRVLVVADIRII